MVIYSHEDYPQLGPSWWELRNGCPTASEFKRIITAEHGRASAGQLGYARELCNDLKLASPKYFTEKGRPINKYTDYGRNLEEEARAHFQVDNPSYEIRQVGMVKTDDLRFGCSPDFLIYESGILVGGGEIKCPGMAKHSKFQLSGGNIPLEYKAQCHGSLAVCGLKFWQWRSYYSGLEPVDVRLEADDFTMALRVQLEVFWELFQNMKKEMGVAQPPDQMTDMDQRTLAEYRERLGAEPTIETVNSWLHELPDMAYALKREVWYAIKAYCDGRAWEFSNESKTFVLVQS